MNAIGIKINRIAMNTIVPNIGSILSQDIE